jgi:hypothetical protein
MAVEPAVLIGAKQAEDSQTTQYTAAASTTVIIDKFTVTNTTASPATIGVNIVTSGGSASDSNLILDAKSVPANGEYICPEIVGQILAAGDFISTIAGTASALTIRASGRVVS